MKLNLEMDQLTFTFVSEPEAGGRVPFQLEAKGTVAKELADKALSGELMGALGMVFAKVRKVRMPANQSEFEIDLDEVLDAGADLLSREALRAIIDMWFEENKDRFQTLD